MKRIIRKVFEHLGYDIVAKNRFPPDFDEATAGLFRYVQPFTATSKERVFALCQSVEYVVNHDVAGDIVECGVWKGGSMMVVARTLMEKGATSRKLYLFDTFEGMTDPIEVDKDSEGNTARKIMRREEERTGTPFCYCPLDEVKQNMLNTGYDEKQLFFCERQG